RECLAIIESKSKVRYSCDKPVVAKVSTNASTSSVSLDVVELKDMALLLKNTTPPPAFVKAVEESCVTCGGPHPYYQCLATNGKTFLGYQDNIQAYVSAAAVNYNQGNVGHQNFKLKHGLLNLVTSKQFCGFEKEDPHAHIRWFNKITSTIKYKDVPNASIKLMLFPFSIKGGAWIWLEKEPPHSITTWEDLVFKFINQFFPPLKTTNLQNKISNFQQRFDESFCEAWEHFKDLLHACPHHDFIELHQIYTFYNSLTSPDQDSLNAAAGGNLLTKTPMDALIVIENKLKVRTIHETDRLLPNNTVTNPKGNLKAITTQSGVSYCGPPIPPPSSPYPKVMEREPENLLSNKEKLFELANIPVNKNCLAVILKKLPKKLGDPDKFLIPCNFPEIVECLPLSNLGASINLMPLSIWRKLSLPELTPTQMILDLTDWSTTRPTGITEDIFVKVGKFHFSADFVVVDYVVDPRLMRSILKVLGFSDNFKSGNPTLISEPIIAKSSPSLTPVEGSDFILEEIKAYLASDSVSPRIDDAIFDPEGDIRLIEKILNNDQYPPLPSKDLKFKELKTIKSSVDEPLELKLKDLPSYLEYAFLEATDKLPVIIAKNLKDKEKECLIKGRMTIVTNEDNELIPTRLVTGWRVCIDYRKLNDATRKDHFPLPFMNQKLERLAGNDYYYFLDGFSGYFQISIDPQDQKKTTFTRPYGTFAYRRMAFGLCNSPGMFQRCMMAIFHDMIEEIMKFFMDDILIFEDSFSSCLSHLDKMLKRIEVDREKVGVIEKLPPPTSVKGIWSFLDDVFKAKKLLISSRLAPMDPLGDIMVPTTPLRKSLILDFIGRLFTEIPMTWSHGVTLVNVKEKSRNMMRCLKMQFKFVRSLTYEAKTLWARSRLLEGTSENRASWFDKLDDALWAFCTTFKTPIGCTLYKLVYGRACHLLIKLEHKAYWALKHCNYDLVTAGDHQKVQMNELNKVRDQAYENSLIYKEKTKKIHDSKIKNHVFNVGDQVLLFNSRLKIFSCKLKTRWTKPFTVTQVFSYGTIELSSTNGPNFKVNIHRLKHYFGGDIPPMVVLDLQTFPHGQLNLGSSQARDSVNKNNALLGRKLVFLSSFYF
nr:reverse transcriptase domain-containing protein [Tanacetum cinerariifolium]